MYIFNTYRDRDFVAIETFDLVPVATQPLFPGESTLLRKCEWPVTMATGKLYPGIRGGWSRFLIRVHLSQSTVYAPATQVNPLTQQSVDILHMVCVL